MTDLSIEHPARRFLHICYCCDDATVATDFFVEGLKLKNTMTTTDEYSPGTILGLDYDVRSVASFVYDRRGPRTSPAIEIQGWYDPTPVGEPSTDPYEVGVKALGFAVPSVDEAVARLTGMGCTVVSEANSPIDGRHATLLDPRQIMLELVEDAALEGEHTQMHHLRHTVASLDESLPFYEMLGFQVLDRSALTDGSFAGAADEVDAEFARIRLPDEPFEVHLIQWNTPASHGHHYAEPYHAGIYRAALGVDDSRASYEYLTANGEVFDRPPMEVELSGTPVPDMWITFISDPNGIPYEFVQRPRSAFKN
jgi:catechol 2,3-dioxygenase-like lactoylglutathione lyase family enzyme